MKTVLTIITRITTAAGDNEYERIWSPIAIHHKASDYEPAEVSVELAAIRFNLTSGCLLVVSGTNIFKENADFQDAAPVVIGRFEQAAAYFGLADIEHNILYHNSHHYKTTLLEDFFDQQQHCYVSYHLGRQNDLPIYSQLYAPLFKAIDQYLTNGTQAVLLQQRYTAAVAYVRSSGQSQPLWPTLDFQPLFTEAQREDYTFICNPENFGKTDIPDRFLTSPTALEKFLKSDKDQSTTKMMIVLCELNWTWEALDDKRAAFRGVEVIKQLRLRASLAPPVLFVSAALETTVYRFEDNILFAVGHHFVSMHDLPDVGRRKAVLTEGLRHSRLSRPRLSALELIDIQAHFCDTNGAKRLLLHQLENFQSGLPQNRANADKKRLSRPEHDWDEQFAAICREIGILKSDTASLDLPTIVSDCIHELRSQIGTDSKKQPYAETTWYERRGWNVVIVDDEDKDERYKRLIETLTDKYRCTVTLCRTADEVFKYLNNEAVSRDTRVLIADYRLEESGTFPPKLQAQQGYDVLAHVATRRDLAIVPVAFSGMPRKFLMQTFNQFGIKVEVFSKLDYFKDERAIDDFATKVIQLGDECDESLLFMPKTTHWHDKLEAAYRAYRKAINRNEIEQQVADSTNELIRIYQSGGQLAESFCGYNQLGSASHLDENTTNTFVRIFASRRFTAYVALAYVGDKKGKPGVRKIVEFLRANTNLKVSEPGVFATEIMALRISALPFGLTYEEIRFLKYQHNIDVRGFMYVINPLLNKLGGDIEQQLKAANTTLVAAKKSKKGTNNEAEAEEGQ